MQAQLDFVKTHARRSDPVTSFAAAKRATSFASSHSGRIHQALIAHGQCTAHEIGQIVGLSVVQVDRRLPELAKLGSVRVVKDGGMDVTRDGFRVWEAVGGAQA